MNRVINWRLLVHSVGELFAQSDLSRWAAVIGNDCDIRFERFSGSTLRRELCA